VTKTSPRTTKKASTRKTTKRRPLSSLEARHARVVERVRNLEAGVIFLLSLVDEKLIFKGSEWEDE